MSRVVTFDLFSALTDSRSGGTSAFAELAAQAGWTATGEELYDAWDRHNKAAQRDVGAWVPWRVPATRAMTRAADELGLDADVDAGVEALVASMHQWPTWPDVPDGLRRLASDHRVGLLSNVDDDLFARTAAAAFVDHEVALTSQKLGAYKPHPAIYQRARDLLGPSMVHVATSARDVRGALEAGIPVVRLRRPGHALDPDGPRPSYEATSLDDLATVLTRLG